jgi:hypothetical protein
VTASKVRIELSPDIKPDESVRVSAHIVQAITPQSQMTRTSPPIAEQTDWVLIVGLICGGVVVVLALVVSLALRAQQE